MDFTKDDFADTELWNNHSGLLCDVTLYFYSKYATSFVVNAI